MLENELFWTKIKVVYFSRIQILMAASTKIAVFYTVMPCSLVEVYQCFRDTYCLHYQCALMMETASTYEILVNFYQTTCCNNPEDSDLQCVLLCSKKKFLLMTNMFC
jgi:hypothetical protein